MEITGGLLQDLNFIILLSVIIGCQKLVKQNENYNLSKYYNKSLKNLWKLVFNKSENNLII